MRFGIPVKCAFTPKSYMGNEYIKSPLNYVGGKYKLLSQIMPL